MKKIIQALFGVECKHQSINRYSDDNFCPDCGNRVKLSWVTLRCGQCKNLRMARVTKQGDILPLKHFCTVCGSKYWFSRKKDALDLFESFYAIAVKEVMSDEEIEEENHSTYVWIDNPDNSVVLPKRNIIKARKRG